ncbi:3-phosphoshikimate 1-carboxyvinyltransferase [Pusillimonas sp. T2]|uniref:3-phosphoshikimate 1-carboxyvinyltransferase n=1 Tax=Pusillimonas sp. T2 TaxID=1548123 RepID=UPI000B9D4E35|nr:3-phosphoshikimate 1-carboxyvinyltransferase [Pusillimonas sp. T2]OXR49646.1 3-phosphoshikimate 1-carboxyvinyltransferase [Pusillimonas sp. T2]
MTASPDLLLSPVNHASGDMVLPGSKSISNRVLLLAALARGTTLIRGVLDSDDTRVMLAGLMKLGVSLDRVATTEVEITGGIPFERDDIDIFLGNAGTAFRPLTAALALMGGQYRLSGVARMHERPIGDLVEALRQLGAAIDYMGNPGYPPLAISSAKINAAQPVRIKGNVSSQFLTALLLAAPIYTGRAGLPVVIEVEGELISKPYILITLNLMARFGVVVERDGWQRFTIPAGAAYIAPGLIDVEGDASSASYFLAMGAIGAGPVRVHGVGVNSIQGDVAFADTLEAMGATIVRHDNFIEARGIDVASGQKLRAFDFDFNLIPDAAMTAAALALFADGTCTLRNIGSWRVKETDRIHAMHTELEKLGASVKSGPDWLRITPPASFGDWRSASIATYDDHRMAMCFSLASFGPVPVTIQDPDCVSKTFPDYFKVFSQLVNK